MKRTFNTPSADKGKIDKKERGGLSGMKKIR